MTQKGFALITILLILAGVLLVGAGANFYLRQIHSIPYPRSLGTISEPEIIALLKNCEVYQMWGEGAPHNIPGNIHVTLNDASIADVNGSAYDAISNVTSTCGSVPRIMVEVP
jgi:hypothetical protein